MQPSVSVIIPVYNIEKHLEKCLDSVIGQTLKDIEIIVVNDGSTDNSLDIITQYARKDSRIVIVDKPNEGLAYARKSGIEAAHGKYVQHLDGDDFLEPDAFQTSRRNRCRYSHHAVSHRFTSRTKRTAILDTRRIQ